MVQYLRRWRGLYDGSSWDTWATEDSLGGNNVTAIRQDKDGLLWFLHAGSGLSRYDPQRDSWQIFGDEEGALDWPSYPAVDSQGNLWIGGYGELLRFDGDGWQVFTSPDLTDVGIYGIEIGPDDVKWLTTDIGVMRQDPVLDEWTTFTVADHPILENVWALLPASDGTVWVGGEDGLIRYDGEDWSVVRAERNGPDGYINDIKEASDGSLWMVADGELYHNDGGRWDRFSWPGGAWFDKLAIGPDGSVWVGSQGLGRFDPSSGSWETFTTADGLGHSYVQTIHVTPDGVVWVGTLGGVSRFVLGY